MKLALPVNILLIEDNPGYVRLSQKAFREAGIDVHLDVTMGGIKSKQRLCKNSLYTGQSEPDQILLDFKFPKLERCEALETIKSNINFERVLAVTPSTSNADENIINSLKNNPVGIDRFYEMDKKMEDFWLQTAVLPSIAI